ncbi:hypothetical protein RCZ04_00540 [Capnocytophaga sp. HP1101]
MKLHNIIITTTLLFSLQGCIKSEAPNAEADILTCEVDGNLLIRQPIIQNTEVKLYVNDLDKVKNIAPRFTLTEGATISPTSGTVRDFTTPQSYVVTSQDGNWQKMYKVSCLTNEIIAQYHFENARITDGYYTFYDTSISGEEIAWSSGNAGFKFTNNKAAAQDYPTAQANDGYQGKCVKLVTRSTGVLGKTFGAPIAAGNLFTGSFEIDLFNPAKSTHFGTPFKRKPTRLSGYYKYKAGEKLTDKNGNVITGQKDNCDIYAVFYEVTSQVPHLDGTNIKTHNNIVLMAQLTDKRETDNWVQFSIPFKTVKGRSIDTNKLKNGKYSLAIVLSSSEKGAEFTAAVGSTLYVDELQLSYD